MPKRAPSIASLFAATALMTLAAGPAPATERGRVTVGRVQYGSAASARRSRNYTYPAYSTALRQAQRRPRYVARPTVRGGAHHASWQHNAGDPRYPGLGTTGAGSTTAPRRTRRVPAAAASHHARPRRSRSDVLRALPGAKWQSSLPRGTKRSVTPLHDLRGVARAMGFSGQLRKAELVEYTDGSAWVSVVQKDRPKGWVVPLGR